MHDERLDDVREHRDGELFPGFESIPLYHGADAAVGRSWARRDSPLWDAPLPHPERGVLLTFPRRPYWVSAGGKPLAVTPHGMRVLAADADVPRARSEHGFDVQNVWIHVTADRLAADLRRAGVDPETAGVLASRVREVPLVAETHMLLHALVSYLASDTPRDARSIECSLSEIIVSAMTGGRALATPEGREDDPTWNGHAAAVHRARMFLARNYAEPVTVDHVARAAGLSRSHLSRVFRDLTGQSVHAFRNDLRLREALWRLPDYRQRIGELGVELGFSSASHFTTAFRSRFGTPPASYNALSRFAASWRTSE